MKPTLVILAAGIGSRYGGLKQMDKLGPSGESIIDYSVYDAIKGGFGKIVFVIREDIKSEFTEVFNNKFGDRIKLEYAIQDINNIPDGINFEGERIKPWGTGHAVMVTSDYINEPFGVINADDFYGAGAFHTIAKYLSAIDKNDNSTNCMVGYQIKNTLSDFGYVSRGICEINKEGYLDKVTENLHIERVNEDIISFHEDDSKTILDEDCYVSMNFWGFNSNVFDDFRKYFRKFLENNDNILKSEYFIPLTVSEMINAESARIKVLKCPDKWFGITYKEDKPAAIQKLRDLVDAGEYPENLWK